MVELVDLAGDAFAAYRYDAWGNPTATETTSTNLVSSGVAADLASRQILRFPSYV